MVGKMPGFLHVISERGFQSCYRTALDSEALSSTTLALQSNMDRRHAPLPLVLVI